MIKKNSKGNSMQKSDQKAEAIIKKMYSVLFRAQRKVDDVSYRKVLKQVEK